MYSLGSVVGGGVLVLHFRDKKSKKVVSRDHGAVRAAGAARIARPGCRLARGFALDPESACPAVIA